MSDTGAQLTTKWKRHLMRIYLSGFICLLVLYVLWRAVNLLTPLFEAVGNPVLATLLAIITLIVVPPVLGLFVQYVLNPVMGRWNRWSELISLEDRIAGQLASEESPHVVLVNWPTPKVRCIGLMTARFPATENSPELAAVFTPSAPGAKTGYIRVVPVADVEFTDWTFAQFQAFQWTIGSLAPESMLIDQDNVSG